MIPVFNLLEEPWILANDPYGKPVMLSIRAAFERAHELTALSGELPTQDVAILRLLLAILYSAFPYEDENGEAVPEGDELDLWRRLWSRGRFPMGMIDRYLQRYRERFWLFHAQRPFYQVPGLDKGTSYSASKLIGDLSESSNKPRLFQTRNGSAKSTLSDDEAARWLLYLIAFDDTSAKPTRGEKKMLSPGAGWLGKLGMLYAVGANLFETLLLNFVLVDGNDGRWETGGAAWEPDLPRTAERVEIPIPASQAALLTLQSRRVSLERTGGSVTGFRLLGGDFFVKENAFAEQMTVWRRMKDREDVYTPKRHHVERHLWRDFSSLIVQNDGARTPGIVRWLRLLQEEGMLIEPRHVRLRASGVQYGDKDFFVTDLFDDTLSVHAALFSTLGDAWNTRITGEIEHTEKAVNHLAFFASELAKAAGDSAGGEHRRKVAHEEVYFRLDVPFREWLLGIDPAHGVSDDICSGWRRKARDIILRLGREILSEAGDAAFIGRTVKDGSREELLTAPKAYNKFRYLVHKALEG